MQLLRVDQSIGLLSFYYISSECPPSKQPHFSNSFSTNKPSPQKTYPQIPLATICELISLTRHNKINQIENEGN